MSKLLASVIPQYAELRAEMRAKRVFTEAPESAIVAECRRATGASLMRIKSDNASERRARVGWLRAKCLRCGACDLF